MCACGGGGFWLHAVGVDVEEFEGAPLERGLLGQLVEADVVAGEPDPVAGEGGEGVEQVAEARGGKPGLGSFCCCLRLRRLGAAGGGGRGGGGAGGDACPQ